MRVAGHMRAIRARNEHAGELVVFEHDGSAHCGLLAPADRGEATLLVLGKHDEDAGGELDEHAFAVIEPNHPVWCVSFGAAWMIDPHIRTLRPVRDERPGSIFVGDGTFHLRVRRIGPEGERLAWMNLMSLELQEPNLANGFVVDDWALWRSRDDWEAGRGAPVIRRGATD